MQYNQKPLLFRTKPQSKYYIFIYILAYVLFPKIKYVTIISDDYNFVLLLVVMGVLYELV
mgnify:CR=1 FL=1